MLDILVNYDEEITCFCDVRFANLDFNGWWYDLDPIDDILVEHT